MSREFDSPWKETFDLFFESFLSLFFPSIHQQIDWSVGYESLDNELQKLVREGEIGKGVVDKLFKVRLNSGQDAILLLHLEMQSQVDLEMPHRLFVYHYRIYDRYAEHPVQIVILGDDRPDWRPEGYIWNRLGCQVKLEYLLLKLLDFRDRIAELEAMTNPLGVVIAAHLISLNRELTTEQRKQAKLQLYRQAIRKSMVIDEIRQLLNLIDWLIALPVGIERELLQELSESERGSAMPYISSFEQFVLEKGEQIGLEKGIQIGREQALDQGREEGIEMGQIRARISLIEKQLQYRFGTTSPWLETISQLRDLQQLDSIFEYLLQETDVEKFNRFLEQLQISAK